MSLTVAWLVIVLFSIAMLLFISYHTFRTQSVFGFLATLVLIVSAMLLVVIWAFVTVIRGVSPL